MFSETPPATQRLVEGQETLRTELLPSMLVTVQVGLASVGSVEAKALPEWSTPTQRLMEGQETSRIEFWPSTLMLFQLERPPEGLVEIRILPLLSPTAQ